MNAISKIPSPGTLATPSLADATALVPAWYPENPTRQRDVASDLTTIGRMLGLPLAAIPCDVAWLNERVFRQPAAAFGMSRQRFRNVVSSLRATLRHLGLHQPCARGERGLPPEWRAFLETVSFAGHRAGLRGFARHCAEQGIGPAGVTDATLAGHLAEERQTRLSAGIAERGATVTRAWNRAITAPDMGACRPLTAPRRRQPYTLPFERYPESFQAEVEAFSERMCPTCGAGVFSRTGNTRRARPATLKARLFAIRQAAAALVLRGHDPSTIRGLRDLVDPVERAGEILDFYHERAVARLPPERAEGAKIVGGQFAMVADTLLILARHVVGLTGEPLHRLQEWRKSAHPRRPPGMTGKVRERLRRLIEPRTRSRLLLLPEDIVKAARESGTTDAETLRRIMVAVAVEILLACPLRMKNLTGLRLDRHLQRIGHGGRRITHIVIDGTETKNEEMVEWPVPADTASLLETWIKVWRPLVAGDDTASPYLFPGRRQGQPISQSGLGNAMVRLIHHEIGVRVHPHLMRHFAAWRHLNRHPGQYEIVRRALGHRSVETTIRIYCGLETDSAARLYFKGLEQDRAEARQVARLARPARRGRAGR